jgi:four helix bundle protein
VIRFEDLIAWQRARAQTSAIYAATREGAASRDFRVADQIRSAAFSVMSNVAEGFERESGPQFVQFLQIARASAGDVRSLLYVALDLGYVGEAEHARLHAQCLDVTRLVTALRNSVSRRVDQYRRGRLPSSIGEPRSSYDVPFDEFDEHDLPAWLLNPGIGDTDPPHSDESSHVARST